MLRLPRGINVLRKIKININCLYNQNVFLTGNFNCTYEEKTVNAIGVIVGYDFSIGKYYKINFNGKNFICVVDIKC